MSAEKFADPEYLGVEWLYTYLKKPASAKPAMRFGFVIALTRSRFKIVASPPAELPVRMSSSGVPIPWCICESVSVASRFFAPRNHNFVPFGTRLFGGKWPGIRQLLASQPPFR